jgi:biotin carboxylase
MMGGSSKSKKNDDKQTTGGGQMPQMKTFGGAVDPAVTAQLKAAGLLGIMPPQASFGSVSVPILTRPDEVEAYLKSIGKTPVAVSSSSGNGSNGNEPFVKWGSI